MLELVIDPGKNVRMDVSKSGLDGMACAGGTSGPSPTPPPSVVEREDRPMDVKTAESGAMIRASLADTTALSEAVVSLSPDTAERIVALEIVLDGANPKHSIR